MVPHAASGAAPRSMGTRAGESPEAGVAIRGVARISGMAPPLPMREGGVFCSTCSTVAPGCSSCSVARPSGKVMTASSVTITLTTFMPVRESNP